MKIETKFDRTDPCFFMDKNRITKGKVLSVEIEAKEDKDVEIKYRILTNPNVFDKEYRTLTEDKVFKTKEELVEYLLKQ